MKELIERLRKLSADNPSPRDAIDEAADALELAYEMLDHLCIGAVECKEEIERLTAELTTSRYWREQEVKDLTAENLRLAGEVSNRNQRALDGDKAVRAFNSLYEISEKNRVERDALKAALRLIQANTNTIDWPDDINVAIQGAKSRAPAQPLSLEDSLSVANPCCGKYANCSRPCTPRGRWEAQQAQQPLTDEQIQQLAASLMYTNLDYNLAFARAIEAHIKGAEHD